MRERSEGRSARQARRTRIGLGVAALLAAAVAQGSGPATAADVHGDDERDAYVGTGGLLLPASVDVTARRAVAQCADCAWRLTTPCIESGLGHPFDGQSACMSVVRGCPAAQRLLRAWSRSPGRPWREVGLVCLGPGGPTTVAEVAGEVGARTEHRVPPLLPTHWPAAGVVTQLPTLFSSGQPGGPQAWATDILGRRVEVRAVPRWTWQFGDGAEQVTDEPGGRYPIGTVSHVYRNAAVAQVVVITRWTATFMVDGLGPFPVPEPIDQRGDLRVSVGEGRALLAPR